MVKSTTGCYTLNMNIDDIEKLEELSRMKLTPQERESMLSDMKGIIDYVKVIEGVEVEEIESEYVTYNVWRNDEPIKRDFSHDRIVDQFPDKQDGFLKVKKIL